MPKSSGQGTCTGTSCPGGNDGADRRSWIIYNDAYYTGGKDVWIPIIKKVEATSGKIVGHCDELDNTKKDVFFDLIAIEDYSHNGTKRAFILAAMNVVLKP